MAEAANFANESWIDFGKTARLCSCTSVDDPNSGTVRFDMATFVQRYQPGRYRAWLQHDVIGPSPSNVRPIIHPHGHTN